MTAAPTRPVSRGPLTGASAFKRVVIAVVAVGALVVWQWPQPSAGGEQPPISQDAVAVAPAGTADTDGLQPSVHRAIDKAIQAAAAEGVELRITSGWRSPDRQAALFEEAVAKYGSADAARRWVLPAEESEHVTGEAVDVGPPSGAAWLAAHGEQFGLCQRYANEPWHFERLAGALGSTCPPIEEHP